MPSAFTGALLGRFTSSTSPPQRILTISAWRMRCHRLSVGELPHSARVFAFPELVASMRAVCACLHMKVLRHDSCALLCLRTWDFLPPMGRAGAGAAGWTTSRPGGPALCAPLTVFCPHFGPSQRCAFGVVFCRFVFLTVISIIMFTW